jgi:hypothetical protein
MYKYNIIFSVRSFICTNFIFAVAAAIALILCIFSYNNNMYAGMAMLGGVQLDFVEFVLKKTTFTALESL